MFSTACVWIGAGTRMREWPDVVDYVQADGGGVNDNDNDDDDDDVDDKQRHDVDIDVPLGDDLIRHEKDEYYVDVDDDEEREDDRILPTDVVLLTANTDSEAHSLVVTVFDDIDDLSWYNHHDYFLTSLPVSVEWLDFSTSGVDGSFAAVGARHSLAIEVWNLDVMNAVEVAWTLGDVEQKTRQSTIALAWNPLQRKLLASGCTDNSLSLWDVRHTAAPVYTSNTVHSGGVQALAWNPASDSQLLSAGFDQVALLHDARTPQQPVSRARLENEPESVKWLSAEQPIFIVAEEKGRVEIFDARSTARALLSFEAHSAPHAVTGLAVSHVPTPSGQTLTVVATCSTDTTVKLWNMTDLKGGAAPPPLIHSKTTGTPLFCLDFCRDAPTMLACGGETGFAGSNIANELANL